MTGINYKFDEDKILAEIKDYIDSTYGSHYAKHNRIQAMEIIIDDGDGKGFTSGNITKYNSRYGKKNGYNKADLLKIVHYAILALYVHDLEQKAK